MARTSAIRGPRAGATQALDLTSPIDLPHHVESCDRHVSRGRSHAPRIATRWSSLARRFGYHRPVRAALTLVGAGALFACNPFPSYDGLTGGVVDASAEGSPGLDASHADGGDAGAGPYDCAAAILCENFEQGLGNGWMQPDAGTGVLTGTTSMKAAHGQGYLQATVPHANSEGQSQILADVNVTGDVYVRLFAWIPSSPTKGLPSVNVLADTVDTGGNTWELRVQSDGPQQVLALGRPQFPTATTEYPFGAWSCIEWQLGSTQQSASQNGTSLVSQSDIDAGYQGFTQAYFGLAYEPMGSTATGPVTVYIDEIIVDTKPIGCDAFQ
jgi:hypothetical protein